MLRFPRSAGYDNIDLAYHHKTTLGWDATDVNFALTQRLLIFVPYSMPSFLSWTEMKTHLAVSMKKIVMQWLHQLLPVKTSQDHLHWSHSSKFNLRICSMHYLMHMMCVLVVVNHDGRRYDELGTWTVPQTNYVQARPHAPNYVLSDC